MTKTETVIRSIFGAAGIDTRPLARAVDIAAELLFTHRQTIDALHFTRDIYSPVAVLLRGQNRGAAVGKNHLEKHWASVQPVLGHPDQ